MTVRFAGYAAVFDRPDRGGDILRKGAFARAPAQVPLLWGHDARQQIGTVAHLREDARGLQVIAEARGRPVRIGQGLSFGYRVRAAARRACGAYRELTDVDLVEISLVRQPMQPLARVLATAAPDPAPLCPQTSNKETEHGV